MKLFSKYKQITATFLLLTTTSIFYPENAIAIEKEELPIEDAIIAEEAVVALSDYTYIPNMVASSIAADKDKFSLLDKMNLRVENQGITNICWAFSLLKSMETNIALENNARDISDFSERHMAYATSRTFIDGTNEKGFDSEVSKGGLLVEGLAYLTNGQGAVLEKDMPFENNEQLIYLQDIEKTVDTVVNDYYVLPAIYKEYTYDSNGNTKSVKYTKSDDTEYTVSELRSLRQDIKNHLVTKGAICTMTAGTNKKFYNGSTIFSSTAYNCNDTTIQRDHAVTIIGWDDTYSKDNFAEGHKPSTDGAYIVLNSYGEDAFDNGILYISYEDYFVEMETYGIQSTAKFDYDNIYQTDFYGGIYQLGIDTSNQGYYGAIFTRDANKREKIDSVGITLSTYANVEIYLNPNGSSMNTSDLIKVGESSRELTPGYHRIYFDPIRLNEDKFSIVVKQISSSNKFYFEIETPVSNTPYSLVTSDKNSYISFDGKSWENLSNLNVSGIDMKKTDVCIKAFTDDMEIIKNELSSEIYNIKNDCIYNIGYETTIEQFKNNLTTDSETLEFTFKGENVSNGLIKTGMKMKLYDDTEYILVVRGDINQDGKVTLTDLSKLILHYNEMKGFELSGDSLKGADLNMDERVSLIDVSQMLILYNSI